MGEMISLLGVGLGLQKFRDLVMSLPKDLRFNFRKAIKQRMSLAHAWMMLITARRMLDEGMEDVHFHHELKISSQEKLVADVYGSKGGKRYYAECKTSLDERGISERAEDIKEIDPLAEFILVLQDRIGWDALDIRDKFDHIWIACKDGKALDLDDWINLRVGRLNDAVGGFSNLRRIIDELSELSAEEKRSLAEARAFGWNAIIQVKNSLALVLDRVLSLEDLEVSFSADSGVSRRISELKEDAAGRIFAAACETLSLVWPLKIVYRDGRLNIEGGRDEDFYWHNWPNTNGGDKPSQEKLLKDLRRVVTVESKILLSAIMPEITREGLYNGIAAILDEPLKQEIARLILYVSERMQNEIEKISEILSIIKPN